MPIVPLTLRCFERSSTTRIRSAGGTPQQWSYTYVPLFAQRMLRWNQSVLRFVGVAKHRDIRRRWQSPVNEGAVPAKAKRLAGE